LTKHSDIIRELRERGVSRVAIQAPEGLKREAVSLGIALQKEGFFVVMSGDPCYGSCDLDLDSLGMAEILLHIGHAPVDYHEGVMYEYYPVEIDPAYIADVVPYLSQKRVGLVTVIQHVHCILLIQTELQKQGIEAVVKSGGPRTPKPGQILGCSYEAATATGCQEILYVGTGLFHPLGVQIATDARVIALDPVTGDIREVSGERMMRIRFGLIEKAKQADRFGILLSTKTGQRREELACSLASLHPHAVIITIREVRSDQLLNLGFPCYVNTACPRLAYDDQDMFPVPVITPQEFEIICGVRKWEEYEVDQIP